eukprot:gene21655-27696_t
MDNHRPFHLRNVHSRHNVVLFDDESEMALDEQENVIPADGEDVSSDENDSESGSDGEDDRSLSEDDADEEEIEMNEAAIDEINAAFGDDDVGEEEDEEEADDEAVEGGNEEGEDGEEGESEKDSDEEEGEEEEVEEEEKEEEGNSRASKPSVRLEREDDEEVEGEGEEGEERNEQDEGEDREEEEEEVRVVGKRRRASDGERQAKQRKRDLTDYYKRSAVFAAPTAVMLMQLVTGRSGSQLPLESVWQAILGVTDQFQRGNIAENHYDMYHRELVDKLGNHLMATPEKVIHGGSGGSGGDQDVNGVSAAASEHGNITDDPDYRFFLHRHWSLLEAMQHSPYIAAKLSVWNAKGVSKLNELLARMGLPLAQCKQHFQFMTPSLRDHFYQQMGDAGILNAYKLSDPPVVYRSFQRFYSFANSVAASDVVHAASALVEMYGSEEYYTPLEAASLQRAQQAEDGTAGDAVAVLPQAHKGTAAGPNPKTVVKISSIEAFYSAYACLGRAANSDQLLRNGIKNALDLQRTIVRKAAVMMDGRDSLVKLNRLYYAYLRRTSSSHSSSTGAASSSSSSQGGAVSEMEHTFGRAQVVTRLGQFIMDVKRNLPRSEGGWTGSTLLPLILLSERQDDSYLVVGISPLASQCGGQEILPEHKQKLNVLTNFREFYKQAAHELRITKSVRNNSFDSNVLIVSKNDVQDFLGTLDYCYKKATPVASSRI